MKKIISILLPKNSVCTVIVTIINKFFYKGTTKTLIAKLIGSDCTFCGLLYNNKMKIHFHGNCNNFVTEAEKKWMHGDGPQFFAFSIQ